MAKKKKSSSPFGDFNLDVPPSKPPKTTFPNISEAEPQKDTRRAFTQTQKNEILAQQGYKCAKCHRKLGVAYHFYHSKSWSSGGKTTVNNGRVVCADCHETINHRERLRNIDKKRKPKDNALSFF